MKQISVLGSTGSIGTQTLEVVRANEDLAVAALAAGSNIVLQQGCGVFIEFDDEIHISKFDYGY